MPGQWGIDMRRRPPGSGAGRRKTKSEDKAVELDWEQMKEFLNLRHATAYPLWSLIILSGVIVSIVAERIFRFAGLERQTRSLTRKLIDLMVERNVEDARKLCAKSKTPMSAVFGEGLRWRAIALEDLTQILSTARQELLAGLRRGVWFIGTIGSLAPYIGLLGTVIGIMQAFGAIAESGDAGFEVVSSGISEALVATAIGLVVAILALTLFNWLSTWLTVISATCTRASERFVQALLFLESGGNKEVSDGSGTAE